MKQENTNKRNTTKWFAILGIIMLALVGIIFASSGFSWGKLLSQFSGNSITPATAANMWSASANNPYLSRVGTYAVRIDGVIKGTLSRGSNLTTEKYQTYLDTLATGIVEMGKKPAYVNDADIQNIVGYIVFELGEAKKSFSGSNTFFSDYSNLVDQALSGTGAASTVVVNSWSTSSDATIPACFDGMSCGLRWICTSNNYQWEFQSVSSGNTWIGKRVGAGTILSVSCTGWNPTSTSTTNTGSTTTSTYIDFQANNCTIAAGKSTCVSALFVGAPAGKVYSVANKERAITTSNLIMPSSYTTIGGTPKYMVTTSVLGDAANYITNGINNLDLLENGTVVARAVTTGSCISGTTWNGTSCAAPVATVATSPDLCECTITMDSYAASQSCQGTITSSVPNYTIKNAQVCRMYKADNTSGTCNGLVASGKTSSYTDNNKCGTSVTTTTNPVTPTPPPVTTPTPTPAPTTVSVNISNFSRVVEYYLCGNTQWNTSGADGAGDTSWYHGWLRQTASFNKATWETSTFTGDDRPCATYCTYGSGRAYNTMCGWVKLIQSTEDSAVELPNNIITLNVTKTQVKAGGESITFYGYIPTGSQCRLDYSAVNQGGGSSVSGVISMQLFVNKTSTIKVTCANTANNKNFTFTEANP